MFAHKCDRFTSVQLLVTDVLVMYMCLLGSGKKIATSSNEEWVIFYVKYSLTILQCSNDSVLGAVFHPMEANLIVTCGKSHINFWTMEGSTLAKRQGLFEVCNIYFSVFRQKYKVSTE